MNNEQLNRGQYAPWEDLSKGFNHEARPDLKLLNPRRNELAQLFREALIAHTKRTLNPDEPVEREGES